MVSLMELPKESSPDVTIPTVRVTVALSGASPDDVERVIILPIEREISGINGMNRLRAWAFEGRATVRVDFNMGTDMKSAIRDVKDAVDRAKVSFPSEASTPLVSEDNPSLYPIMAIGLSGSNEKRDLVLQAARDLKKRLEQTNNVFEVDMVGDVDEIIEVSLRMKDVMALGLTPLEISSRVNSNNRLINSGNINLNGEEVLISVPGMIVSENEISSFPITIIGNAVITLGDIADIHLSHRDRTSSSFINGKSSITLNISKNIGSSTVSVAEDIHQVLQNYNHPEGITVHVMDDQSIEIKDMLRNLAISVLITIAIVIFVLSIMLNISSALMVGTTIPLSFMMTFIALYAFGYTANSVVLFGLILATGLLVDAAIIVSESSDRLRSQGVPQYQSYLVSARRMGAPIVASTLTTIAAFLPMLFWPGTTGQFMKYLPLTVILSLLSSLLASLVLLPAIASIFNLKRKKKKTRPPYWYVKSIIYCVRHPLVVLSSAVVLSAGVTGYYYYNNAGVVFFPEGDAENITVRVYKEGSNPIYQLENDIKYVESLVANIHGIERINSSVRESSFSDMIGSVNMSLTDWRERPDADIMIQNIREAIGDITPLTYEIQSRRGGLRSGKPIAITLSHEYPDRLNDAVNDLIAFMESDKVGTLEVTTERKVPGKQWDIVIDRGLASFYGVDLAQAGEMINMATRGSKAASLILPGYDDEVDVMIRLPEDERDAYSIINMMIPTESGLIPLAAFSDVLEKPKTSLIRRSNQERTMRIEANVEDGLLVSDVVNTLRQNMDDVLTLYPDVNYEFRGEAADSEESQKFIYFAFIVALLLMLAVLLLQLNSWIQAGIIFSAIAFSVVGVLITLLILNQPFGIVFSGLAILSLVGISINHNIILIDEFNHLKKQGMSSSKAAVSSSLLRFRAILMTILTTSIGLIPMMLGMSVDIGKMSVSFNDPAMSQWTQLSSNIVGGLIFSAAISLLVTPCLLSITERNNLVR